MSIPILMYHQIDTPPKRGTPYRGLIVSPADFARQMGLLKLLGYRGLSITELVPYVRGEKVGKVVGVTFDDGYQNNLINALPVLKKNDFTATCYIVSSAIGGTNLWDRGIIEEKRLMNLAECIIWLEAGMDIGSHSRSHADLKKISAGDAKEEIENSKHELEGIINREVSHFCYPYGSFTQEHKLMVINAGYQTATTTLKGKVNPGDDPFSLNRITVSRSTNILNFARKILMTQI